MIPKEKAKELIEKFRSHAKYWDCRNDEPLEENHAKQCALIAVDEILDILNPEFDTRAYPYYQEVKNEINKL